MSTLQPGDPVQSAGVAGTVLHTQTVGSSGCNVVTEVYVQWAEPTGDLFLVGVLGSELNRSATNQHHQPKGARA